MNRDELYDLLIEHQSREWSLQGFGMFRTYLGGPGNRRLHIWDSRFRNPGVSMIHDHPWTFTSHVLVGEITNVIYRDTADRLAPLYNVRELVCGPGGGLCDHAETTVKRLEPFSVQTYVEGDAYTESFELLHRSIPLDGTVTLIERVRQERGPSEAFVAWPLGEEWGTAEPRPARPDEIADAVDHVLARWFGAS